MKLKKIYIGLLALCLVTLSVLPLHSTSMLKMNMSDLINQAEYIVVARVVNISDGFDAKGLAYTQVTIEISDALKGNLKGRHTFKQYGLLKPRDLGNGKTHVGISPDGFPRFVSNEEVVLFLYHTTALGFQPVIGLMQGKFNVENGLVSNAIDNQGLFNNVKVDESKLRPLGEANTLSKSGDDLNDIEKQKMVQVEIAKEKSAIAKLVSMKKGAIEKEAFVSFVRNAVNQGWFAK